MYGVLHALAKLFVDDTNAYDVASEAAKEGDEDAKFIIDNIDVAMRETGVVQTDAARSEIGNLVLKLAFFMDSSDTKMLEVERLFPEIRDFADTYGRFMELVDIGEESRS